VTTSQSTPRVDVLDFLRAYDAASDSDDADALRPFFAETFMNLSPGHAIAVSREALLGSLAGRRKMFSAIHATGLSLTTATERVIDEHHTWVETTWEARFDASAPAGRELTLSSGFLLQRSEGAWRITVYLNHQDVAAALAALQD
jgi:hypothetical protein